MEKAQHDVDVIVNKIVGQALTSPAMNTSGKTPQLQITHIDLGVFRRQLRTSAERFWKHAAISDGSKLGLDMRNKVSIPISIRFRSNFYPVSIRYWRDKLQSDPNSLQKWRVAPETGRPLPAPDPGMVTNQRSEKHTHTLPQAATPNSTHFPSDHPKLRRRRAQPAAKNLTLSLWTGPNTCLAPTQPQPAPKKSRGPSMTKTPGNPGSWATLQQSQTFSAGPHSFFTPRKNKKKHQHVAGPSNNLKSADRPTYRRKRRSKWWCCRDIANGPMKLASGAAAKDTHPYVYEQQSLAMLPECFGKGLRFWT